jgi:hypothetical protein
MIVQSTNDRITIRIQANDPQTKKVFPLVLYVPPFAPETPLREIRAVLEEIREGLQPLLEGVIVSINYSPAGEYFASYNDEDLPRAPSKTSARVLAGDGERRTTQRYTLPFIRQGVHNQLESFFLQRFGGSPLRLRASGDYSAEHIIRSETEARGGW